MINDVIYTCKPAICFASGAAGVLSAQAIGVICGVALVVIGLYIRKMRRDNWSVRLK